jgi:hypothetical protein
MMHRNERGIPELPKWILVEGSWQNGASLKSCLKIMEKTTTNFLQRQMDTIPETDYLCA